MTSKKIVVIDNYDSFTFNLVQYLQISAKALQIDADVEVLRNDATTPERILAARPMAIVISPGPATPDEAGISLALIQAIRKDRATPLLGVCLGHQAIGQAFGGRVVRATEPMHGKTSLVEHNGLGVYKGLAQPLKVTRYHSLVIDTAGFPHGELEITSQLEDTHGRKVIMGVRAKQGLIEGVQFHPESCLTESGLGMVENFLREACGG